MFVSVLMVRVLVDECQARGLDAAALLSGLPLTTEQLADSRHRVPAEDFQRLAQRAMDLTADDGLGLSLGSRLPSQALQVVGYLLSSAPTLRHAYNDFHRYASLLAANPRWAMREDGDHAQFEVDCPVPQISTRRMANDWALSLAYRLIGACAPNGNRERMSVLVGHSKPAYAAVYERVFGTAVRFGQPGHAVVFPRAWLDLPQRHGDEATCEGLRDIADRLLASVHGNTSLADRLRVILRRETQLCQLNVAELARKAAVSESALRRSLATEGLSPSQLVDEARCRIACAELDKADASVKHIANALGYAEPSSFHRAFKRWTGKTPAHYRASAERKAAH